MPLFDVLGNDLTGEVLSFIHPVELLFSIGFVCKSWRKELAFPILLRSYDLETCDLKSFDVFFITKKGRSFVRLWIRMLMYDIAQQLQIHSNSLENYDTVSQMKGLEGCLENITFYLSHFHDLTHPNRHVPIPNYSNNVTHQPSGTSGLYLLEFLIGKIGAVVDYFKRNSTTNSQSTPQEPQTMAPPPSKIIDRIKCIMEGKRSVGKTSFVNCIMLDQVMDPLVVPVVIGAIDFKQRKYSVENDDAVIVQMFDSGTLYPISRAYYRGCRVAFLMFDLTDRITFLELKDTTCVKMFLEEQEQFEIVLIGNKVDVVESGEKKREVTKEEALEFANDVLDGALYVESTNANLRVSSILGWYVMIHHLAMKHVMVVNGGH